MIFEMLFAPAIYLDLDINYIDIKMAFHYKLIYQLIFIESLNRTETKVIKNVFYQLLKGLYSFEYSSCLEYKRFLTFLLSKLDLTQIYTDYNIFVFNTKQASLQYFC